MSHAGRQGDPVSPRSHATPESVSSDELRRWSDHVRRAREQAERIRFDADTGEPADPAATLELSLEALSVAEEELHVQQDELRAKNEALLESQLQLEAERQRYWSLFHEAPVAYLVTDAAGIIREANAAAARLLGYRADRLRGKPLTIFVHQDGRPALREQIHAVGQTGATATMSLQLTPRLGAARGITATVATDAGAANAMDERRWLLVDETERLLRERQAEALNAELEARVADRTSQLSDLANEREMLLREAERARHAAVRADTIKNELLATVSHELRTPLSAIAGYAELLTLGVHGELNEAQASDVQRIMRAEQHMVRLVDDLLIYFQLGTGQLRVQLTTQRVAPVLAAIEPLIEPQARARGVTFTMISGDAAATVHADPDRVRQVVLNLLSNAIRHTPAGGRVELGWEAAGPMVAIRVRDTGIGIAAHRHEEIFEPFVQLEPSFSPARSGFGLGLAISRALATAMHGSLTVESREGHGATFILQLPLADD